MKSKLLICFKTSEELLGRIRPDFDLTTSDRDLMSSSEIINKANQHKCDALLVTMGQRLSPAEIKSLPESVKIVATTSVGFDHLDLPAFRAQKIAVTNTPDVLTDATADLAFSLLLNACRRTRDYLKIIDQGWGRPMGSMESLGIDLKGKTLGILGMGRIGQALALRAEAFGINIIYCNRKPLPEKLARGARYFSHFHAMLPQCQFLSLNAPASVETENIMGAAEFKLLPKDAVFVNVARGNLVDENALFEAIKSRHLFAAGLDVCRNEPNPDPRFLAYTNIILTPHVGSATRETRLAMGLRAIENIHAALNNEKPRDLLN